PVIPWDVLIHKLNLSLPTVRAMEEAGILEILAEPDYRNPYENRFAGERRLQLNEEQQRVVDGIRSGWAQGDTRPSLIYGITGSGKTETYMELIEGVIREGSQAIVLIPEIALTYQTVMRFYRKFGDRVSIMNSRLSAGERYDQMMRAKEGKLDVMIGPRSALFTPFPDLGLIVIDEEHESAYKSEQVPRYHARETAIERARLEHASVVLGSATPSMEAFYRCEKGEYRLLKLERRVTNRQLPSVYIADMREELKNGNKSILSDRLKMLMEQRLDEKQQIMLFLNRRGYAGFLSCRSCGYVVKCPHCDVSLSSHKNGKMICHYCGYEEPQVTVCPVCGSRHIGGFRAGTQQIEELVKKEFPKARVLRMDLDTTRSKEGHEKILSAFANEEADILVGTQMIVKGHDFPNVTLVGILAADMSLYADDYRSAERTFELLTQAAGRAGRGRAHGEVVIQTYNPEHYSIQMAATQDYERFYEEEMNYRELMGYPPAQQMMAVLVSGADEKMLETGMYYLKEYMERLARTRELRIVGPTSPHIGKIKDIYYRMLYVKSESYAVLVDVKDRTEQYIELNPGFSKMKIQFDFNPE
ncbi:MAG: primosomal protein N', partial [bacterium]|nr:primosomal protein N' [bacterium]